MELETYTIVIYLHDAVTGTIGDMDITVLLKVYPALKKHLTITGVYKNLSSHERDMLKEAKVDDPD